MKLPCASLFKAKLDCETPGRDGTSHKSQHRLISKRFRLIPFRLPSDQLQIVVFSAKLS
jgi:hypothetical protein